MKLTNRKIVNDANLLGNLTHKQLPIKVSYAIAKNISKIEKELEIYNKERQKLIDKYCKYTIKDKLRLIKSDIKRFLGIKEYL